MVDFYCHEARLVVEVDGDIHDVPDQQEYDVLRQNELQAPDLTILRFRNERIFTELSQVLQEIAEILSTRVADASAEVNTQAAA